MNILNILNNKELSDIPILYILRIIAKYNTTKYHIMGKRDLFHSYFLYKFSKNTCILYFYVLQYNYIRERR